MQVKEYIKEYADEIVRRNRKNDDLTLSVWITLNRYGGRLSDIEVMHMLHELDWNAYMEKKKQEKKILLKELNKIFGTNVTDEKYMTELFKFYSYTDDFYDDVGKEFDDLVDNGTATFLNGNYVFFNECNYDWKTGKPKMIKEEED